MKFLKIDIATLKDSQKLVSCVILQDSQRKGVDLKISFETYKLICNTFGEFMEYAIQVLIIFRINLEKFDKNDELDYKIIKFIKSEFLYLHSEKMEIFVEKISNKPQRFFAGIIN